MSRPTTKFLDQVIPIERLVGFMKSISIKEEDISAEDIDILAMFLRKIKKGNPLAKNLEYYISKHSRKSINDFKSYVKSNNSDEVKKVLKSITDNISRDTTGEGSCYWGIPLNYLKDSKRNLKKALEDVKEQIQEHISN